MGSSQQRMTSMAGKAGLPGDAHKLRQMINTNFIKTEAVTVGMKSMKTQARREDGDTDKAIDEFDSKLAEITAMLTRYKDESSTRQGKGEDGTTRPKAKEAASRAGTGRRNRKEDGYVQTEEEAYLSQQIQRRVPSVAPGAPRSLNIKVDKYRNDTVARVSLAERCAQHKRYMEEEEAKRKAALIGTHDFIRNNVISLQTNPEPYLSRVMSLSPPHNTHNTLTSMRSSSPSLYGTVGLSRPVSALVGGGRGGGFRASATSVPAAPAMPARASSARGAVTLAHSASAGSGALPGAGGSAAALIPTRVSLNNTSFTAHAHFNTPATHTTHTNTSIAPSHDPTRTHATHVHVTQAVHSRPSTARSRTTTSPQRHTSPPRINSHTHKAMSVYSGDEGSVCGVDGVCERDDAVTWTGTLGGSLGGLGGSMSREELILLREARLAVTSRPASGGSPSRRQDYIAQRHVLAARRAEHATEVQRRHEEIQEWRQQRVEAIAEQRQQREAYEVARRQAEAAQAELEHRHKEWLGITTLAYKLNFLKQEILAARKLRPLRALRKECALKIAAWYKEALERRSMQALMDLIHKVRVHMKPHLQRKRDEVRKCCAHRIVHFLESVNEGGGATAAAAVSMFRRRILLIQDYWRTAVQVKRTQKAMLYAHFSRFEKFILRRNSLKSQGDELAARQRLRSANRSSLTLPSSPKPGDHTQPTSPTTHDGHGHAPFEFTPCKSRKHTEVEDPLLEALLASHKTPLTKDIRMQIVSKTITDQRRKFLRQMQSYRAALDLYRLQLPMEELRMRLLQDAGLEAVNTLKKPIRPVCLVLVPKPTLKRMLQEAINMTEDKRIEEQEERRRLAEQLWLEHQAAKQQAQTQPDADTQAEGNTSTGNTARGAAGAPPPRLNIADAAGAEVQAAVPANLALPDDGAGAGVGVGGLGADGGGLVEGQLSVASLAPSDRLPVQGRFAAARQRLLPATQQS